MSGDAIFLRNNVNSELRRPVRYIDTDVTVVVTYNDINGMWVSGLRAAVSGCGAAILSTESIPRVP